MLGQRYRILIPTVAILIQSGAKVVVTIPADSIVEVVDGPILDDDDRLMNVQWDGKTVAMFTTDIHQRGERVEDRKAKKSEAAQN